MMKAHLTIFLLLQVVVDIARFDTPSSTEATPLSKLRASIIDEVDPCIIERFVIPIIESMKSIPESTNLLNQSSSLNTQVQATRKGNSIILTPEKIFNRAADRAIINPKFCGKNYSFIYASGSFLSLSDEKNSIMAHSICKVNALTKETLIWSGSDDDFPGEPVFIPADSATEEDDGILVSAVSSASPTSKDYLVAIDGQSFKEIGRAAFDCQIPMAMHGVFLPK